MRGLLCAAHRGRHTHQPASRALDGCSQETETAAGAASGAGALKLAEPLLAPPAATLAALPREVLLRVAVLAAAPLSAW